MQFFDRLCDIMLDNEYVNFCKHTEVAGCDDARALPLSLWSLLASPNEDKKSESKFVGTAGERLTRFRLIRN